jgi:hypothetical protein
LTVVAGGCGARFVDERPPADRGPKDLVGGTRAFDLSGLDLEGITVAPPGAYAAGVFDGRAGHFATGAAELFRRGDGAIELRFDAAFSVSDVPGPEVYLSPRELLGTTIKPGDLDLGPLLGKSGAQTYLLFDDDGRRNVFVYCKPYGIEVARAMLATP